MTGQQAFGIDKRRVRAAFERAAARYDEAAVLQHEVGNRLLERLDLVRLQPERILDLGCGTGRCTVGLAKRYRKARVVALDFAVAMLHAARARAGWFSRIRYLGADAERLPLADGSVDMIFSNLTVQWCVDLDTAFAEMCRVLRPDGLLMFTTFGPDTLNELRAAWAYADGFNHVNRFLDMHDIGDALMRAGLAEPVMDVEHLTVTYPNVGGLMHDLKTIGAHNATAGRPRGLTGPTQLRAMEQGYERFRRPDGALPATYEVVYGHAWGARPSRRRATGAGETAVVSLEGLRRR